MFADIDESRLKNMKIEYIKKNTDHHMWGNSLLCVSRDDYSVWWDMMHPYVHKTLHLPNMYVDKKSLMSLVNLVNTSYGKSSNMKFTLPHNFSRVYSQNNDSEGRDPSWRRTSVHLYTPWTHTHSAHTCRSHQQNIKIRTNKNQMRWSNAGFKVI